MIESVCQVKLMEVWVMWADGHLNPFVPSTANDSTHLHFANKKGAGSLQPLPFMLPSAETYIPEPGP